MTFITLYHEVDGCEIPKGYEYLMVVSHEVDANGNWIPSRVEPVKNNQELQTFFRNLMQSGEKFVIRVSCNLRGIPARLGISVQTPTGKQSLIGVCVIRSK